MSQILEDKKKELLETAYKGCTSTKQFQNVYTNYLKDQFKLMKLPAVVIKLQKIMDENMKMSEVPTDEEIQNFANKIETIAVDTKSLKNASFSGLEFIAMTYVFADNQG